MRITDRYASAVRSSNLRIDDRSDYGDTDVLGAFGLADRRLTNGEDCRPSPLSVPLERLFTGDNNAAAAVVTILADMGWRQARKLDIRLSRAVSEDLARACLAWFRDNACKPCGRHGALKIPGTNVIGSTICGACKGLGTVPFEKVIHPAEIRPVATWMVAEMDRAKSIAGPAAMKALAPMLDL